MIAKLTGTIDTHGDDWLIIDVMGVGYHVTCSRRTLSATVVGEKTSLLIETLMRAEQLQLFGFAHKMEQDWFKLLITVQGVGPKVGVAILSALTGQELEQALLARDKTAITRADGVGPKLAERIVNELKDKFTLLSAQGSAGNFTTGLSVGGQVSPILGVESDTLSALANLGYRPSEAGPAVKTAIQQSGEAPSLDQLIRVSLSILMKGTRS